MSLVLKDLSVPVVFLKWYYQYSIFEAVHYRFHGYQDENFKLVSQQYRGWSDYTNVQTGRLTWPLFWWQRPVPKYWCHLLSRRGSKLK